MDWMQIVRQNRFGTNYKMGGSISQALLKSSAYGWNISVSYISQ